VDHHSDGRALPAVPLLQEPGFEVDGVSATSAGAINAVVLAHGLTVAGREGAVKALADFWRRVAGIAQSSFLQPSWYDRLTHNHRLEHSPSYFFFDMLSHVFSPYQINPLNYNPLRSVLEQVVDFEALRRRCAIKLFLCATNVRTGKIRVSPTMKSARRACWHPPACRFSPRRSRSMENIFGMAATWATRRCFR
jgi:NTE family protein